MEKNKKIQKRKDCIISIYKVLQTLNKNKGKESVINVYFYTLIVQAKMEKLKKNFLELREKMLEKFDEEFEKHIKLGESEVPIKSFGPLNGVYLERGNKTYFIRPRIRAGIMTLEHLKGINEIAKKYGDGEIKLTTRHGIQIRGVKAENVRKTIDELEKYKLYTQAVGGKSVRGMIISSFSGFEKEEFDVIPYAVNSINYMFQNEDTYSLPGKLKFAASNSSEDTGNAKYSDMGFIAKKIEEKNYFEIYFDFGMNLSNKNPYKYSKIIKAEEMVYYMRAIAMMFKDNMDLKNPRARLRTMNRLIGLENFEGKFEEYLKRSIEEIDSVIDIKELYTGITENYEEKQWAKAVNFSESGFDETFTRNVKESSKQNGIYAIRLKYQGGVIRKGELDDLIEYLESLKHEITLKLTNNQDIIVFNLNSDEIIEMFKKFESRLIKTELEDSITCTGVPRCRLAITSSKATFNKIIKEFENNDISLKEELPQLRISGCPNSCSLTFKGDIGFSGRLKTVEGAKKIAYTLLSENKNIIHAGKAIILEDDLPKMMYEMAKMKRESGIKDFHKFINEKSENVNQLIEKYI